MKTRLQTVTVAGEACAVVPLRFYDDDLRQALDDAADAAILAHVREHDNAGDEGLPAEYFRRIIRGEHPVRIWREFRGMKPADLARAAGVSASCLSEIEAGRKSGSARTLMRLAEALHVDMEELVPADAAHGEASGASQGAE